MSNLIFRALLSGVIWEMITEYQDCMDGLRAWGTEKLRIIDTRLKPEKQERKKEIVVAEILCG